MLMSITSAPAAATRAAAERITSGSSPNSWIEIGPPVPTVRSSGWMRSISVQVRSLL
jgi:hypothetical protein